MPALSQILRQVGIQYPHDVPGGDVESDHCLDVLVLDQIQSWGWEDILFVECGDGWAAEEAWRRRRTRGHVMAVDRSPGSIERARTLRGVLGRVEFATWDGRQVCQPSNTFDQLISRFAFQISPHPQVLARELLRVLRPQGELYALEPKSDCGEVREILASAGFSEIEQLDGGVGTASAILIHARARVFE